MKNKNDYSFCLLTSILTARSLTLKHNLDDVELGDEQYGEWQGIVDEYAQKGWYAEGAGQKYVLLQRVAIDSTKSKECVKIDDKSSDIERRWWVYLVRCADNTFYCGISTDPVKRENEHNSSTRGAKYTSSRRPVSITYLEGPMTKPKALQRECLVKALKRSEKENLAIGFLESKLVASTDPLGT